ncbi:hydrogenase expression/formation protein HypE [Clostridium sp. JN-9]|uniref:hydrogenase expression/formation protein HypE n=1 Tax=Clostridium sp. JN-9 TaxID=2507159 RepID=UPI000FFE1F74|nr:hydrogenase expression/formation protein HypE [Clostridium sp. JN-9]QAT39986.1 hydrogenase expression/formation protein HypE [Clostridium sp. JN-9]
MEDIISLSYGNGGTKTDSLIKKYLLPNFGNNLLNVLGDGALLNTSNEIAFSTDSFVIYPLFFPGGDIGKLSVCGTVNDLLMCGSIPKYLSLSFIIEEGFLINDFEKIVKSVALTVEKAGVQIVTGDTKVVDKGHGHGIYINTSGIGERIKGINLGKHRINPGDKVIVTGNCGDHGISVLCAREKLFEGNLKSDCNPLNNVIYEILKFGDKVKILRDPTRGGVATTLNEFAEDTEICIELDENKIPVDKSIGSACDLLGLDPLYSANEGKAIAIVSAEVCDNVIDNLKKIDISKDAAVIGEVTSFMPGKVILNTPYGGRKILNKLSYDMLPRIC